MSRSELSLSDDWETPNHLYQHLCGKYNIHPTLDVAADFINTKTKVFHNDSLDTEWCYDMVNPEYRDVWCNPPHSKTESFVKKADEQWKKHNINILMIVPANSICAHYFDDVFDNNHASYYRISGRPQFLRNGKVSKFPSRNSYFVVIWRKTKRLFD